MPERCVVAFLDILGFKDGFEKSPEQLFEILKEIRQNDSIYEFKSSIGSSSIRPNVFSISDSIIFSYPLKDDSESELLRALLIICTETTVYYISCLQRGFSLRGAIATGNVYYINEHEMIGEPYIEAMEDEKKNAIYPRVIASQSLLQEMEKALGKIRETYGCDFGITELFNFFRIDADGILYVDWMRAIWKRVSSGNDKEIEDTYRDVLQISQKIKQIIELKKNDLSVFLKWHWLANYFDTYLDDLNVNFKKVGKFINKFNFLENNLRNLEILREKIYDPMLGKTSKFSEFSFEKLFGKKEEAESKS